MRIHRDFNQGEDKWLQIRKGKITWTKLKWVLWWPKANATEAYTLLAEKYIEEEDLNAYEILERGGFLEPIAKQLYEDKTKHTVEEVWFIEADNRLWLSPDWIIDNGEGLYTWALEIKCPRGKNYIKYYIEEIIPAEYMQQVINYFVVIPELERLDFMIFNSDIIDTSKISNYKIIRTTRKDLLEKIEKAQTKIDSFKKTWEDLENKLLNN